MEPCCCCCCCWGVQVRVYCGFSITCSDCGVHGRSSHCSVPATTKSDSWPWTFHPSGRSRVSYALCFHPNSSGTYVQFWSQHNKQTPTLSTASLLATCPLPPLDPHPTTLNFTVFFSSTTAHYCAPDTHAPPSPTYIYSALKLFIYSEKIEYQFLCLHITFFILFLHCNNIII